ncbi:MAG: hemin uptake protein HemP [Pseudomonadota bacterium]
MVQDHYASVPTHAAEKLMAGGKKAVIVLEDQIYTLQITRQGKLLLTK